MRTLDDFIKRTNLILTGTLTQEDFCKVGFDFKKQLIDYKNCLSLYQLVSEFNEKYKQFKKDYNSLNKLDLGKDIDIINFTKGNNYRFLTLYTPMILKKGDSTLVLTEKDDEIYSVCKNNLSVFDKNYYRIILDLDKTKVKAYLDLFEKYEELIRLYNTFENQFVYGDGCTVMFSNIEGDFLKNLNTFKLSFGNSYFNAEDFVKIPMNLGTEVSIDYPNVEISLDLVEEEVKEDSAEKLLKKTYINKKYLKKDIY